MSNADMKLHQVKLIVARLDIICRITEVQIEIYITEKKVSFEPILRYLQGIGLFTGVTRLQFIRSTEREPSIYFNAGN